MFKQDNCLAFYTELPENTQVATLDMFYHNNKPRSWMPYLCKSVDGTKYYALRVGCWFPSTLLRAQIINKNAYVLTNKEGDIVYE